MNFPEGSQLSPRQQESSKNIIDDRDLINFLQSESGCDVNIEEIDMGQIDEEDRKYIIIDKDTGLIFDLRNEERVSKITK